MHFLRGLLFSAIMWLAVAIWAPLSLLTFPFPFPLRFYFISRWACFHVWLVRVLCGVGYRVQGREHLPSGPAIIMAKHQSAWETLAFAQIFPPQTWVLKRELLWIPLFGWALALLKPIAIDRRSGRRAMQQVVHQGRARLAEGIWITVFPEGTRVMPGQRRRWGIGGAVLASESGCLVVPVAHNAGHYWPRHGLRKRPGTIDVVIGPAIETRGKTAEQINREAEAWITQTMRLLE
ncbi:MAG: 1-acyl-sn-glycerol-3-phosphate acyltransferase [Gammaproteobacteria bacterium]|nr:1-acyl-sn-glycerol-3-phosphate acyltransferase [Gammaproteobacteria bacterium]